MPDGAESHKHRRDLRAGGVRFRTQSLSARAGDKPGIHGPLHAVGCPGRDFLGVNEHTEVCAFCTDLISALKLSHNAKKEPATSINARTHPGKANVALTDSSSIFIAQLDDFVKQSVDAQSHGTVGLQ